MSARPTRRTIRRRRRIALGGVAASALAATLAWHAEPGTGASAPGALVAQPVLEALGTTLLGSSPTEAPGETWGVSGARVMRYTSDDGWRTMAPPVGLGGQPIAGLSFAPGAHAGRTTARGGVAIAARTGQGTGSAQLLVIRDPGGPFRQAPDPGAALQPGEALYASGPDVHPLLAPADGTAGTITFVAPAVGAGAAQTAVLALDGTGRWTREAICTAAAAAPACTAPAALFKVLAIDASAPDNAWLLARSGSPTEGIALFRRDASSGQPQWRQTSLGAGSPWAQATPPIAPDLSVRIVPRTTGEPLTVTDAGVWIDAQLTVQGTTSTDATLYVALSSRTVTGAWCDVPQRLAALCPQGPLAAELPAGDGRSFAWPDGGPFGQRVVTGVGQGAILTLQRDRFARLPMVGGNAGTNVGAAFSSADEGWLGANGEPIRVTRTPEPSRLQPWPVPFRRPLTAIAAQPGTMPGALDAQALVVGDDGQVARYAPGEGWVPEFLLSASGARATPRLRAVAWPQADRAYAVGDNAEMWLWRRDTGLWEPDPAKPPNLVLGSFTGIAFDPADPQRGYAIGKQGLLLRYDKQWQQEALPPGVDGGVHLTSIAFAGREAIVAYKRPLRTGGYEGGLLLNDGSGWRADDGVTTALGGDAPERVAALPDGGAVVASTTGVVAEREGPGDAWTTAPGGTLGFPVALAAIRETGRVRAVLSIEFGDVTSSGRSWNIDSEALFNPAPPTQAPLLLDPYPLATTGYLVRQTATGWHDEQHEAFPVPQIGGSLADWPLRPDAVLALLLDASGREGWTVGGETGAASKLRGDDVQTAGVMRYPAGDAPPPATAAAPIASAAAGTVTFAVGGNAQCANACADLANTDIGPETWLPAALGSASQVAGLRAFLYTGPGVADGLAGALSAGAYARESERYATRLASGGSLPTFAAPAASDLDASGTLATFAQSFAGFGAPLGGGAPGAGIAPLDALGGGHGYAFASDGPGGAVRVVVLDYSARSLGDAQRCWLAQQLSDAGAAGTPALVVGNRDVSPAQRSPNAAGTADAAAVVPILVNGTPPPGCTLASAPAGASAYLFDYPEQNRTYAITSGTRSIPTFGSGTLGYVDSPLGGETDHMGASGFLLVSVDLTRRDSATNVAPVTAQLIPSISDLALDATDGTLLRRSQPALFEALARRPRAGMRCNGNPNNCTFTPDPYIPIPSRCQGPRCASGILPTYAFRSSNPDIADFVKQDPASTNPRHVLLDANDKPVAEAASGLLCAFNAGTTTVTVTTGGLSYSQKVTVQPGSVQRPCGTVPLRNPPTRQPAVEAPQPPPDDAPQPQPGGSTPLPPPPPPHAAAVKPAPHPHAAVPLATAFVAAAPGLTQVIPVVPPPAPTAARPIPPSGTASVQVYQSAVAPERQRDEEVAVDLVHHAVAARPLADRGARVPAYLPALIALAALGGATVRDGRRRRGLRRRLAFVESGARGRRR